MKLSEVIDETFKPVFETDLNREVNSCYIGDLLSFVMANGKEGCLWLTVQKHLNVIAVAELNDFAGVIFVQDNYPEADTIKKAKELDIPLFTTALDAYQVAKHLCKKGL